MTREEREMRLQIENMKAEARQLVEEHKIEEAEKIRDEIIALTKEADLLADLEAQEIEAAKGKQAGEIKDERDLEERYSEAFFKAFRRNKLSAEDREVLEIKNSLSETGGTPEGSDGGYLVPQDLQTAINTYMRDLPQLRPLVRVIPVNTLTGSRVYEKVATLTAFANITDDTADINEMANPTFEQITYSIKKYAGWMPVPNDLLKDSDQNILAYLAGWIGKKSVVTQNSLILSVLGALTPSTFADQDDLKEALNVTLDPMLAMGAVIVTNQYGFHYLDTLTDGAGRPLVQVDVTQPTQKLFAGKPIRVISTGVLPNVTVDTTTYAPFYVGNFNEGVFFFERQGYQVDTTNIGGTAFRKDRTEIRVIEREDVKAGDADAIVYGRIDITSMIG